MQRCQRLAVTPPRRGAAISGKQSRRRADLADSERGNSTTNARSHGADDAHAAAHPSDGAAFIAPLGWDRLRLRLPLKQVV